MLRSASSRPEQDARDVPAGVEQVPALLAYVSRKPRERPDERGAVTDRNTLEVERIREDVPSSAGLSDQGVTWYSTSS